MPSSEKQEADTKKSGELSPKNNAVSFKVLEDNTSKWRTRQDFDSMQLAESFITTFYSAAAASLQSQA